MKGMIRSGAVLLLCVMLSGCLYPKEMRVENKVAGGEYVLLVQNAVDQFQAKTGVLPIKNSELTTPLYEKYPIDFKKLKGRYLSEVPANAFENGGTVSYVLVDVETKPTVKMMDILSFQKTIELQQAIDEYKMKSAGLLPLGEMIVPGFYAINYTKMNRKPEEVPSVYTRQIKLPFLIQASGEVLIDYSPEIMRLIDKKQLQNELTENQDLREILVKDSYFVPARSVPYHWQNGQPVPVISQ